MQSAAPLRNSLLSIALSVAAGLAAGFALLKLAPLQSRVLLFIVTLSVTFLVSAYFEAKRAGQPYSRFALRALITGLVAGALVGLYTSAMLPYVER